MTDYKQELENWIIAFQVSPSHHSLLSGVADNSARQTALELLNEIDGKLLSFTPRQARKYVARLSQPFIKQSEIICLLTSISDWLNQLHFPDQYRQEIEAKLIWNLTRCESSPKCSPEIKASTYDISAKLIPYREMKSFTTEELRQILRINDDFDDFLETGDIQPEKDVVMNHLDWLNKNLGLD